MIDFIANTGFWQWVLIFMGVSALWDLFIGDDRRDRKKEMKRQSELLERIAKTLEARR